LRCSCGTLRENWYQKILGEKKPSVLREGLV
jgi:hypothetical protein